MLSDLSVKLQLQLPVEFERQNSKKNSGTNYTKAKAGIRLYFKDEIYKRGFHELVKINNTCVIILHDNVLFFVYNY